MIKRSDGWYNADKGKHFVLTEKGKAEVASYKNKTVGEPVSEYDYEAVGWSVESGYEIEVDIPGWVKKEGYEVGYSHKECFVYAGNPIVFPERELAEKYMEHYKKYPWLKDHELYIRPAIYEGRALEECRVYDGRKVYNKSWYFGIAALCAGDLVEKDVVDALVYSLPSPCLRGDCAQMGEPMSHKIDANGVCLPTYATFRKIAPTTWEYCGNCFRGENVERGTLPPYVQ